MISRLSSTVGLGVEVDDEDLASLLGDGRGEIDGCGRLADAAFLIHQGDDAYRLGWGGFVHFSEYIGISVLRVRNGDVVTKTTFMLVSGWSSVASVAFYESGGEPAV